LLYIALAHDEPPTLLVAEIKLRHGSGFGCLLVRRLNGPEVLPALPDDRDAPGLQHTRLTDPHADSQDSPPKARNSTMYVPPLFGLKIMICFCPRLPPFSDCPNLQLDALVLFTFSTRRALAS
jgi:hypothetical protein